MWARIRRLFRSMFGIFIRSVEDPELLLEQAIDDIKSTLPEMRSTAAEVVSNEKMLERQAEREAQEVAELEVKLEQAAKGGKRTEQAALSYMSQLDRAKERLEKTEEALERAKMDSRRIKRQMTAYERKAKDRIAQCQDLLTQNQIAEAEEKVAELMGGFEVADTGDTIDRAQEAIDKRIARARARVEIAEEGADSQMAQVEIEAQEAETRRKLNEYKRQMGFEVDPEVEDRTMDTVQEASQEQTVTEESVVAEN